MNAHKPLTPIVGLVEKTLLKNSKKTKKWAPVSEIASVLGCSFCGGFPQSSFFQCESGHLLCGAEAERCTRCPHQGCDSFLAEIHLAWLKWTAQSADFACPADKDCEGLIKGTADKDGHVKNTHPEIYYLDTSSLSGSIEALEELGQNDDETDDDKFSYRGYSSVSSTPQSSPSPQDTRDKILSRKMRALRLGRDKDRDESDSPNNSPKWNPLLKPAMKELPPARPRNWTPKVDSRELWLHPPASPQMDQDETKWEWT